MAVADTNDRCVYVDIGSYGKRPRFYRTEGPDIQYFFVGDEGFALNKKILRHFRRSNLSIIKRM